MEDEMKSSIYCVGFLKFFSCAKNSLSSASGTLLSVGMREMASSASEIAQFWRNPISGRLIKSTYDLQNLGRQTVIFILQKRVRYILLRMNNVVRCFMLIKVFQITKSLVEIAIQNIKNK